MDNSIISSIFINGINQITLCAIAGAEFFGTPAEDVMNMWHKKEEDPTPFETWANSRNYKRVKLKCKSKMEEYNDAPSVKIEIHSVESCDHSSEALRTLSEIASDSGAIDNAIIARGLDA